MEKIIFILDIFDKHVCDNTIHLLKIQQILSTNFVTTFLNEFNLNAIYKIDIILGHLECL